MSALGISSAAEPYIRTTEGVNLRDVSLLDSEAQYPGPGSPTAPDGQPRISTRSKTGKRKQTSTAKIPPKNPGESQRKSRKKAKTLDTGQESIAMNPREMSLAKNRVAACKSRIRKKRWTENLEDEKQMLETMRRQLQAEYLGLLQESSQLKDYLLSHASCHEPSIDIWIQHEASKYMGNLADNMRHRDGSIQSSSNTQGQPLVQRVPALPCFAHTNPWP
jgi:hypothetical protein